MAREKWRGVWQDCKQLTSVKEKIHYAIHRLGYSNINVSCDVCEHRAIV